MTVSSELSYVSYDGDGVTTVFPIPFYFLQASDLVVALVNQDGSLQELSLGTDYTVSGAGKQSGGTLTLQISPPTKGRRLIIDRDPPATQETAYQANDPFPAEAHERALDKLTMLAQRVARTYRNSIHFPLSENTNGTLPRKSERTNMVLGFDALGQPVMVPVPSSVGAGDRVPFLLTEGVDFAGGDTQITLPRAPGAKGNLSINFAGVPQDFDQWSVAGSTVTFSSPIPPGIGTIWGYIGSTLSISIPPDFSVTDPKVASETRLYRRIADTTFATDPAYGAVGNGITDNLPAFTAVTADTEPGRVKTVYVPDGDYFLSGAVPAGAGRVNWEFSPGARLTGPGSLPFQKSPMTYNASPNYGARRSVWHGTDAHPSTDGVVATDYIQRVDESVTADNPSNLISTQYVVMKRKTGGTGWLYTHYAYLEDQSNSGQAQSVAVAGAAHTTISADVWGVYGEANSHSQFGTITGGEFDALNHSGVDYPYYAPDPVHPPPNGNFSCGVWAFSAGGNRNSFGIGIGAQNLSQTTGNSWGAGLFLQAWSCTDYGIDIQAQPKTLINFKYGASTDGSGLTVGGIGLDCGAGAAYGGGANQCAIHLRDHRLGFGNFGFMQYSSVSNSIEFWSSITSRSCRIDLATGTLIPG